MESPNIAIFAATGIVKDLQRRGSGWTNPHPSLSQSIPTIPSPWPTKVEFRKMLRDRDEELLKPVKTYDEEPHIFELAKWLAIFAVSLITALTIGYFAYRQLSINLVLGSRPAEVSLAELEQEDKALPSSYLQIGDHLSLSGIWLDDTYPIVSVEGTVNIPQKSWSPGQRIPIMPEHLKYRVKQCRILVRNPEELKREVCFDSGIEGMVVGTAADLDLTESQFDKMGITNPKNVYVLEIGRKPNMLPGLALIVLSFGGFAACWYSYKPLRKSLTKFNYE